MSRLHPTSGSSRRAGALGLRRQVVSAGASAIVLLALTVALGSQRSSVSLTIVFLVYLAAVVAVAALGGPIVGVSTAVVAFLVVNFFFTEPLHTLNVADPERVVELLVFLAVSGTVATLMDTAMRRREVIEERTAEATALAAANDLRTALLRAVSHDLRTPLTTAKVATSSLLAADVELAEAERDELVRLADQEIDRLVMIVENLLDASRLQAGAMAVDIAEVDGEEIARRAILVAGTLERVELDVEPSLPAVSTDAALLERIIVNLVSNAAHAAPGDIVAVSVRSPDADGVVIAVTDRGPGLTGQELDEVMQPFHRLGDRGASTGIGLGLPICAGFADAIGARLEFATNPDGGLTVSVHLPVEPTPTTTVAAMDAR